MEVHLVDGTYELFRHFYAVPTRRNEAGEEVAATRGVVRSMLGMLEAGATHLGVATDHVVESFRNELWPGYKTGEGIDPELREQFPLLEEALEAVGITVWPMVEYEADDALAAAAAAAARDPRVDRVLICTPDKDLAQCVRDDRVVQLDRRRDVVRDAAGVEEKFGVPPASIPDWLALVGDAADGFPGLPGFGRATAARLLGRYGHFDEIPLDPDEWDLPVCGAARLAATLAGSLEDALLFRDLATLRTDAIELGSVDELEWQGPRDDVDEMAARLDDPELADRSRAAARGR